MSAPITNVKVDSLNHNNTTAAAMWQQGDARFHVWFDVATREVPAETLYKNPVAKRGEPGYFEHTRKLDATAAGNAKAIKQVFEIIEEQGLIAAALAAKLKVQLDEAAERKEAERIYKIKEAGPELLTALRALLDADMTTESGITATHAARALIAKVAG